MTLRDLNLLDQINLEYEIREIYHLAAILSTRSELSPKIAPITVAVFPLMNKEGMPEIAQKIADKLRNNFSSFYDSGGSIGRRYRRQDEIGTPLCVTVDFDSLDDSSVTIRDRDTMAQIRVSIDTLESELATKLK